MRTLLLLLLCASAHAQKLSLDLGAGLNATPKTSLSPIVYGQVHLKGNDYIGIGMIDDWSRDRTTFVARYGTYLGNRWYLNSGLGLVKTPNKEQFEKTTYVIGADYVFKKTAPSHPLNFYAGFDFTDEKVYLKGGIKFGHRK